MKNSEQDMETKLSAYAFGELSGEAKAEVEQLLENDPAARAEVEELTSFAGLLKSELSAEPADQLSPERQTAVLEGGGKITRPDGFSRFSKAITLLAVAACLCLLTVAGMKQWMKTDASAPLELGPDVPETATNSAPLKPDAAEPEAAAKAEPGALSEEATLAATIETPPAEAPKNSVAKADKSLLMADPAESALKAEAEAVTRGAMPEPAAPFGEPTPTVDGAAVADAAPASRRLQEMEQLPKSAPPITKGAMAPLRKTTTNEPGSRKGFSDGFSGGGAFGRVPESDALVDESLIRIPSTGSEDYGKLVDNAFKTAIKEPLSTFSVDVDTASYSNLRRFVMKQNQLPPKDAVRIEEMINYFDYNYPEPGDEHPFSVNVDVADCPWAPEYRLVKVGLKAKDIHVNERPSSNLVFLIDVSGSMNNPDKLPLLKQAMIALTRKLGENDRIGIVVYAGRSGVVLEPTPGSERKTIEAALEKLSAGGSTHGAAGIQKAYDLAKANFIEGGVNRVILATDGDFNVGITDTDDLISMVKEKAAENAVFLTVLGFGGGNLKESRMEQLANKGNGNYFYIDSAKEGRRVLVDKLSSTLVAVAKDVKIQIDFNPAQVAEYRLIGYANRMLKAEDFADDTKDAGEIGAGHTVTALYQILPASSARAKAKAEAHKSKYIVETAVEEEEKKKEESRLTDSNELLTVKLRYKLPEADKSVPFDVPVVDEEKTWNDVSDDFRFAAAVAGYGLLLRDSEHKGKLTFKMARELADQGKGEDSKGLRQEFIDIISRSESLR